MAMKSDFAQKLLSDLRIKKERMAASQSSSNSNMTGRDGQAYSRQTYKGTQRSKGQEPVRSNTTNSQRRATGSTRLLTDKENSSQLVQYRSGQSSGNLCNIPMAFLLALQNSGKYENSNFSGSNPMLQFLQQIGRRSLDTGNMAGCSSLNKHSSSQFPTFSNLHVNEISKGVQNLNQILRTSSNGLTFDKYSIEIGKELLKGATDLEESLRMLVDLQDASEYMIKPQRKSRITLLDEEGDDEGNDVPTVQQKQLDLPRFSFDKRSRNSHGIVAKTDPNQRLIELTYHAKTSSFSNNKTVTDSNSEHRRTASWSPNFQMLSTSSEQKSRSNSSQSVTEKGRMSSVIAKLMGLEELPERVDPQSRQKESGLRDGEGKGLKITYITTTNAEIKTQKTERQANAEMKTQKTERQALLGNKYIVLKEDNKVSETKKIKGSEKPEKPRASPQLTSVSVNADEKSQRKYNERVKRSFEVSVIEKTAIRKDKQQGSANQSNKIPENQKTILAKEAGEDSTKHKHRKITDKDESKEPVMKGKMQQKVQHKHKSPEAANMLQEKTEWMEVTTQIEKKNSEMNTPKNQQQKSQQDNGLHQLRMLSKSEIQEEKKREEKNIKSNVLVTTHGRSPLTSKVSSKIMHDGTRSKKKHRNISQAAVSRKSSRETYEKMPQKEQPDSKHEEKIVGDENVVHDLINIDQNASTRELVSEIETEKYKILVLNQKKPAHILATGKKVEITQKLRGQIPRKMNETVKKRYGTLSKLETPSKHHNTVIQTSRQKMHAEASWKKGSELKSSVMSEEGEKSTKETNISESVTPTPNAEEQKHLVAVMTAASNSSEENECRSPKAASPLNANDSSKDIISDAALLSDNYPAQASLGNENSEQKSNTTLSNSQNSRMERCRPRRQEHAKATISWKQEILSENEKKLKEVLIKSPLFLNTGEALFKLNIPVGILHASDQIYQEKSTKSTIDCAYEVMNRKARRQELAHPCFKISIRHTTVSSLDDLVKQLYKDFERLKYYGGNNDHDAAENLIKMLVRDIQDTDPHLNCMWDLGWNEFMYASDETEDTIKEVERQVLDELIEEITSELQLKVIST